MILYVFAANNDNEFPYSGFNNNFIFYDIVANNDNAFPYSAYGKNFIFYVFAALMIMHFLNPDVSTRTFPLSVVPMCSSDSSQSKHLSTEVNIRPLLRTRLLLLAS